MTAEVSHGRGGAGNLAPDDTKYVDGEVVRSGVEGSHGDGAYSSGRGGAGNIGDAGTKAASQRKDGDIIPEVAVRPSQDGKPFHTGRGGAGNLKEEARDSADDGKTSVDKPQAMPAHAHHHHQSLADKIKFKLAGIFKK